MNDLDSLFAGLIQDEQTSGTRRSACLWPSIVTCSIVLAAALFFVIWSPFTPVIPEMVPKADVQVSDAAVNRATDVAATEFVAVAARQAQDADLVTAMAYEEPFATDITPPEVVIQIPVTEDIAEPSFVNITDKSAEDVQIPIVTDLSGTADFNSFKEQLYAGFEIGSISIPRLGVSEVIRYGGQAQIDIGICLYDQMDMPGSDGVALACAHNYNPSWKIGGIRVGDRIVLDTVYGNFVYEAYEALINNEGGNIVWMRDTYFNANPTDLVLMTCYPFNADGADGRRYLIRCKQVSGPSLKNGPVTLLSRFKSFQDYFDSLAGR